ncbi:MAG: hypothetical protein FJ026_01870 [Chloroflexi bacterium]|nr:hypothetical protein [Chloroflexota bacterium]
MITPFGLRHIGLMYKLQGVSLTFEPKSALLEQPVTPLRTALRGYFLQSAAGAFTYVLRAADHGAEWRGLVLRPAPAGFAQARAQKTGWAWNIVRMAPVLDHAEDAATIWYRLLLHLCIAAGERQVQRLFAALPQDSWAEEVFRQASFAVYCHEQIWALASVQGLGRLSARVRPMLPVDRWDVQRLCHRVTPRLVLQAEEPTGTPSRASGDGARAGPVPLEGSSETAPGHVLRTAGNELGGYLHVLTRPRGTWLRLLVNPEAGDVRGELLDHALFLLSDQPQQPVYCAVRDYEAGTPSRASGGGMLAVLAERGFIPLETDSLLVKHTTVQVKEPMRKLVPVLEKRAEAAPTVSRSETGDS